MANNRGEFGGQFAFGKQSHA